MQPYFAFSGGDISVDDRPAPRGAKAAPKGETRFIFNRPTGEARCKAGQGRVEIRGPEDFSSYSPAALKRAVQAFYDALG